MCLRCYQNRGELDQNEIAERTLLSKQTVRTAVLELLDEELLIKRRSIHDAEDVFMKKMISQYYYLNGLIGDPSIYYHHIADR